jgi:hypothetical protein
MCAQPNMARAACKRAAGNAHPSGDPTVGTVAETDALGVLPNMPDAVLEEVCATSGENTDACNAIGCKQNKTHRRRP